MCFSLADRAAAAAQGVGGIAEALSGAVRYSTSKTHLETFPMSTGEQAQSKRGKEVVPFTGGMRRKLLSLLERWNPSCLKPIFHCKEACSVSGKILRNPSRPRRCEGAWILLLPPTYSRQSAAEFIFSVVALKVWDPGMMLGYQNSSTWSVAVRCVEEMSQFPCKNFIMAKWVDSV